MSLMDKIRAFVRRGPPRLPDLAPVPSMPGVFEPTPEQRRHADDLMELRMQMLQKEADVMKRGRTR